MKTEGCVLCGAPPDWMRPAKRGQRGMELPAPYCNTHTADWRVLEFEPLTLIAKQRRASAEHKADQPAKAKPKTPPKSAPKTPPKSPPKKLPKRRRELPEPDDVPEPDAATKVEIDKGVDEAFR